MLDVELYTLSQEYGPTCDKMTEIGSVVSIKLNIDRFPGGLSVLFLYWHERCGTIL